MNVAAAIVLCVPSELYAGIDDAVVVDFGFDDGGIGRDTIGASVVDNVATFDPPPLGDIAALFFCRSCQAL
jgi:hypothetical protein